jgi:transcriptional regulator with XRE-family HTH domain
MSKGRRNAPLFRKKIGYAVRGRRESRDLSQEKLAELASVHRNFVGQIERGERNCTINSLVRIAAGLRCKPSELLADAGL